MSFAQVLGLLNPVKWIEALVKYLRRPKLHVYFDPKETFHTRRLVDLRNQQGHFIHLMVKNSGKVPALRCSAQAIRVFTVAGDGSITPHPGFLSPVLLKWAHETDFAPRDIDPDLPRRLDLCVSSQPHPGLFSLMTQKTPRGTQTDFPPGTYRVTVRARAENATHADCTVELTYAGVWDKWQVREVQPAAA
jgi:hypothetical protein